jgi:hypothetical protein
MNLEYSKPENSAGWRGSYKTNTWAHGNIFFMSKLIFKFLEIEYDSI